MPPLPVFPGKSIQNLDLMMAAPSQKSPSSSTVSSYSSQEEAGVPVSHPHALTWGEGGGGRETAQA